PSLRILSIGEMMMKKRLLQTIGGSLVLLLLLSVSLVSYAQSDVNARVVPDNLFLREGPSTGSASLATLGRGATLTVQGREDNPRDDGIWVLVSPAGGGQTGWVRSDFLLFPADFDLADLPILDPATATVRGGNAPTAANVSTENSLTGNTNDAVNFRTGPALTFDIIRVLSDNTSVQVIGRNSSAAWYQVVAGGQVGWLFGDLVTVRGNVQALPVVAAGETAPGVAVTTTQTTTTDENAGTTAQAPVAASNADRPFSIRDRQDVPGDGRLNDERYLGPYAIYCVDGDGFVDSGNFNGGGIIVILTNSGEIIFFASEAQINNHPADGSLVHRESFFELYKDGDTFQINGINTLDAATGEPFYMRFTRCNAGSVSWADG
ncbi:MAG: SH3 domain-containing protein, partial [Anaerolineales bacterium]